MPDSPTDIESFTPEQQAALAELRKAFAEPQPQPRPKSKFVPYDWSVPRSVLLSRRIIPSELKTRRAPVSKAAWDRMSIAYRRRTPYWVDVPKATPSPAPVKPLASNVGKFPSVADPPADQCDFPIDLVVTWVNDNDRAWQARYQKFCNRKPSGSRYSDAGELMFLLRSIRRFAPWIRTVFIVVDDCQQPLVEKTVRDTVDVRIVKHSTIIPQQFLPTFNSAVIEGSIHNIARLSEQFLYANDDTMLGAPVKPGHFFASDGKAKVNLGGDMRHSGGVSGMRNNAADLLTAAFGERQWLNGWHHIAACCKSALKAAAERFDFDGWKSNRTRTKKTPALNNCLWPNYMVQTGAAVEAPRNQKLRAAYIRADALGDRERANRLIAEMPHLICINGSNADTVADVYAFGEAYWPRENVQPEIAKFSTLWVAKEHDGTCIVTGCDSMQEDLLPFWWSNLQVHHPNIPIIFTDYGMHLSWRRWCEERGRVIDLQGGSYRLAWFKKPFSILACDYEKILWLDVDIEVRADMSELWTSLMPDHGIAMCPDPPQYSKRIGCGNSGVTLVRHGEKLVETWASACNVASQRGDQEELYKLGVRHSLPQRFNHLRPMPLSNDIVAFHWTGNANGKDEIRRQMLALGMDYYHCGAQYISISTSNRQP